MPDPQFPVKVVSFRKVDSCENGGTFSVGYLLLLLLLTAFLVVGCDCAEGETTSAFGPDCCCDETTGVDDGTGSDDGAGTLIFSDVADVSIRRFKSISTIDSPVVTSPALKGSSTKLTRPQYLTMHPTVNELIVADEGTIAILFFADPLSINGDAFPSRILRGQATELVAPIQTFVDTETDELYVLDRGGSRILVFAASSTIDGDVAPIRRIGGPSSGIRNPAAFIVRPSSGDLTVINPTEVLTFRNVQGLNGDPSPQGRVTGQATTFQNLTYGLFDSSNALILADRGTRSLLYFEDFNAERNNQAPTRVISGGNTRITEPAQFVLTASKNMYLANGSDVLYFENVRELVGDPFPNRRFSALNPPSVTIRGLLSP